MNLSKIGKVYDLLGEARGVLDELHTETERAIADDIRNTLDGHPPAGPLEEDIRADWMAIAKAELGVKEVNGKGHNPRILEYLQSTSLGSWGAGRDETPWCSAFVNWVMEEAGIEGTNSAMARSWVKWGREIEEPVVGCIVVLQRGTGSSGHVGFYAGEDSSILIALLGGNQSDKVCHRSYHKSDVLGYRLPA